MVRNGNNIDRFDAYAAKNQKKNGAITYTVYVNELGNSILSN